MGRRDGCKNRRVVGVSEIFSVVGARFGCDLCNQKTGKHNKDFRLLKF